MIMTIGALAVIAGAMLALTLVQHVGEAVVNTQPRNRVLPALGCYLVFFAAALGAFLAIFMFVWPMVGS